MAFGLTADVTCSINFLRSLFPFGFTVVITNVIIIHGVLAESLKNHR